MFKEDCAPNFDRVEFLTGFKDGFEIGTKLVHDFIKTGKKCHLIKRDNLPQKIYDELIDLRKEYATMKRFLTNENVPLGECPEDAITEYKEVENG